MNNYIVYKLVPCPICKDIDKRLNNCHCTNGHTRVEVDLEEAIVDILTDYGRATKTVQEIAADT